MDKGSSASTTSIASSVLDSLAEAIKNPDHVKFQEIRAEYYDILETLKQCSNEAGDGGCTAEELNLHFTKINRIFEKVKRTDEARLDAKVLNQVVALGKANIEKTQSSLLTFKPSEYADNLINFVDNKESLTDIFEPDSVTLPTLSEKMSYLYRSTYGLEPLYGAIEWDPPKKAPRTTEKLKEKTTARPSKSIEKVHDPTTNEENQVEEVTRIFTILKRKYQENEHNPISFLEFVIDPKCFATTVQNIFHTSFLIRDNHVEISFDEYKIPCLTPIRKKDKEGRKRHQSQQSKQSVIEMNMSIWEEAIKVIPVKEAMIPNAKRNLKRPL